MSNIENELRDLGDRLRKEPSGPGAIPPRHRRRIKLRRALFAAGGAVTAIALVATASYGMGLVRDQRDVAPAEDASSTLIRFARSGGFTGDHYVLTIKSDGSALLEYPGSRGLAEPVEFSLEPGVLSGIRGEISKVDWARVDGDETTGNVAVGDLMQYRLDHDGFTVVTESGFAPATLRDLIKRLNLVVDSHRTDRGELVPPGTQPTLRLSDRTVRAGDVVELRIDAPDRYVWGAMTPLELMTLEGWAPIYYWATYRDADSSPLQARRPGSGAIRDIGYGGSATFKVAIPQLDPDTYRITKEFVTPAKPGQSLEDRTTTAEVRFEVVD